MIRCPKCSSENDDEARYCDQCAAAISPGAQGAVLDMPCPACDGEVREVPVPIAVCQECGLHLAADGSPAGECPSGREAAPPEAVEAPPAETEKSPCPVCEAPNPAGSARCVGCGIVFGRITRPVECPQCSAQCSDDKCGCGAVLTLSKLLEYVDSSIKVVCPVCKQLYSVKKDACSDCGSELRPADSLKTYASDH
jgi:hypothetical protein